MHIKDNRFSQPGDEDLTCDIDNVTLTAVVVLGRQIEIGFRDGFGQWICADGTVAVFEPGDSDAKVTEGSISVQLDTMDDATFTSYADRLIEWRDRAVPLRICIAPGRPGSIIEDTKTWLPFPNRPRHLAA